MGAESNGGDGNKAAIQKIIDKYPLSTETFVGGKDGMHIEAKVSRDGEGKIIYVQGRSVKAISAESRELTPHR